MALPRSQPGKTIAQQLVLRETAKLSYAQKRD